VEDLHIRTCRGGLSFVVDLDHDVGDHVAGPGYAVVLARTGLEHAEHLHGSTCCAGADQTVETRLAEQRSGKREVTVIDAPAVVEQQSLDVMSRTHWRAPSVSVGA
jgi:hypothetical protein